MQMAQPQPKSCIADGPVATLDLRLTRLASLAGYAVFGLFSAAVVAATTAVAAGAILAMLVDTMIPEAFDVAHNFAGLITVLGFLVAFALSKWAG